METHMSYQYSDVMEEKATRSHSHMKDDSLEGILKEKGHKMFNKIVEKDVPMLMLHGSDHMLEKIAKKLNKGDHDVVLVTGERGDILQEDKLERFRLKTVNAIGSGVVREEEEQ